MEVEIELKAFRQTSPQTVYVGFRVNLWVYFDPQSGTYVLGRLTIPDALEHSTCDAKKRHKIDGKPTFESLK